MPNISRYLNPADKKQGVTGYFINIQPCKHCGRLTNLIFKDDTGREHIVCSQDCADAMKDKYAKN